jgi:response regulator RpfG family c-di-GMP phosphodiesterase
MQRPGGRGLPSGPLVQQPLLVCAWSEEAANEFLREQKGKHFDPALVGLFIAQLPAIRAIRTRWAES